MSGGPATFGASPPPAATVPLHGVVSSRRATETARARSLGRPAAPNEAPGSGARRSGWTRRSSRAAGAPQPAQRKGFGDILGAALGGSSGGATGDRSRCCRLRPRSSGGIVSGVASAVSALTSSGSGPQPHPLRRGSSGRCCPSRASSAARTTSHPAVHAGRGAAVHRRVQHPQGAFRLGEVGDQQHPLSHGHRTHRHSAPRFRDAADPEPLAGSVRGSGYRSARPRRPRAARRSRAGGRRPRPPGSTRAPGWPGVAAAQAHGWIASSRSPHRGGRSLRRSCSRSRRGWPRRARRSISQARCSKGYRRSEDAGLQT